MDIETIKNEIKEHILDSVQEDAKNATISWLHTTVLPAVKEVARCLHSSLAGIRWQGNRLEQVP